MGKSIKGCLAAALLVGGLPVTAAHAQQRTGQRQTAQEIQRGTTVETRQRPDFDPFGVRLGAFRLDGFLESGLGWDSNVFGRKNNVKGDAYATETGNVTLGSDWTRHAVGASANIDARQFFERTELNWTDWNLGGFGRYDIDAQTNVEARYRHYREHLDVYNFDVQAAFGEQVAGQVPGQAVGQAANNFTFKPVPYDSDEVQVSGNTRFNRFGLTAIGLYRTYRFEDVDINNQRQFVSNNNFDTLIGALAGSYAFAPGRFVTATVRLQDIAYEKSISRGRDSFTWVALLGFEYDFDGVWAGRIGVGYQQRDYNSPQIKNLEGPALEGRLSWSPTQLTTVTFNVARTLEESIRQDAVSYQRTTGGVRVDHEFLRNVILGGEVRVDRREYERPNQTATDGVIQVSGRWLLNRSLSITGSYAYNQRLEATGGFLEYNRHLVQARLRIAL
jgi:hypothetical protein